MKRQTKYIYLHVVQGFYVYGWEDLTASDVYKEARAALKAYRDNEQGIAHRMIQRREQTMKSLYSKAEQPCEKYDPCQYPEQPGTVCFVCGWLRVEHRRKHD